MSDRNQSSLRWLMIPVAAIGMILLKNVWLPQQQATKEAKREARIEEMRKRVKSKKADAAKASSMSGVWVAIEETTVDENSVEIVSNTTFRQDSTFTDSFDISLYLSDIEFPIKLVGEIQGDWAVNGSRMIQKPKQVTLLAADEFTRTFLQEASQLLGEEFLVEMKSEISQPEEFKIKSIADDEMILELIDDQQQSETVRFVRK